MRETWFSRHFSHTRPERITAALIAIAISLLLSWGRPITFYDENRVRGSIPLSILAAGDARGAFENALHLTVGRPGLPIAYAPAAIASFIIGGRRDVAEPSLAFDLDPIDRACARVVAALWAGAAVLAVGALAERLRDRAAGALAAFLLALSVAFENEARTLLPTVPSLALGAWFLERWAATLASATDGERRARAAQAGFLLGAMFAVYPGAYPLGIVVPLDLALARRAARERVGRALAAAAIVMLSFEVLYRVSFAGSYVADARALSVTIGNGDPREGWSYAFEYLSVCDGLLGPALLALAIASPLWTRGERRPLAFGAIALFAFEALFVSTLLGFQALYGRLVTVWLALVVPLAASASRLGARGTAVLIALIALHQAPRLAGLFVPYEEHPAIAYEGSSPAERAAIFERQRRR